MDLPVENLTWQKETLTPQRNLWNEGDEKSNVEFDFY